MARSAVIAVLLIALLGGVNFYLFPQYSSSEPTLSYAFMWVKGSENQAVNWYENKTILWELLDFKFSFANGSSLHEPNVLGGEIGKEYSIRPEYHGDFDATELLKIAIQRLPILICGTKGFTIGPSHGETYTHEDDTNSSMEIHGNYSIRVSLRGIDVVDLGILRLIDWVRGPNSDSGYWKNGIWTIDADQLSSMLTGSGTASINFDATVNAHVQYKISDDGTTKEGENDLSWQGSIGKIEIVYEQTRLKFIRYDFQSIRLVLLQIP